MNNKIYCLALSLLTVLTLLQTSCKKQQEEAQEEDDRPLVRVEEVQSREVVQEGNYTATVVPELINNISSSSPNRIKEILVDEGFKVAKGQIVVRLDDINTDTYEVQVANAKANLANVKINYDRAVQLLEIGGGTQQSVDQMKLQLTNAENALASAERTLRNVQENTVLVSPISGVVTARNYDPGDMTGALPILTVAQVNPVKIVINVSESELSHIHKGMNADVTFDTYGDEKFRGTVTMVSPTVDTNSRTFGVEISLSNPDGRILPGMFGRVNMALGSATHVVVPDKAVVKQPGSGNHYVYVLNPDSTVSYNQVELGQRLGDTYELISGVESGAQVIVTGQTRLANGMAVKVAK